MSDLAALSAGPPLDAVIIGGGINGCGIARELALRGLRVALFEKDDFGFGTTWRSTKLVHGGLRYLEHGDVRLVFESLHERAWLLKTRPHLVRPLRFFLPLLPWTRRPAWQLRAGLAAYDLLAMNRGVPGHRRIGTERLREYIPGLAGEAHGGFSFFDARLLAPERLALELALEARAAGAAVANHTAVTRIRAQDGHVSAVEVLHASGRYEVATRAVVNAGGPWVDAIARLTGGERPPLLDVTRGTHVVLETAEPPGRDAIFTTARSDGRVLFVVPQGRLLQVGTTDDRYSGDAGAIRPTSSDIDYLLEEAQTLLPGRSLSRAQVRYAYAGLRPLQRVAGGPEAAVSRRHALLETPGAGGLYSVVGGKLSTFRPLADAVAARLGGGTKPREVHREVHRDDGAWRERLRSSGLDHGARRRLTLLGRSAPDALALGAEVVDGDVGVLEGEVRWAIREELATTLSDIMMRRTGAAWGASRGLLSHRAVASIAAAELQWSPAEQEAQILGYERDVAFHLPSPRELAFESPQ